MSSPAKVRRGQVWRDGDRRMKGRTLRVEGVKAGYAWVRNNADDAGRLTRIRLDRFRRQAVRADGGQGWLT